MARKNRKCICCHKEYEYCPTCGSDKVKQSWSTIFCSESCMKLWETATKYNMNMLTKPEAKAVIEALELKERSAYVECVQKDLEVILEPEVIVEEKKILEEEPAVVEAAPILEEKQYSKKKQKSHEVVKKENK